MKIISDHQGLSQKQNTLRRNAITRNGSKALASGGLSCIFGIAALDKLIEIIDMSSKSTPDALLATGGDAAALIGYGLGSCVAGLLAAYYGHRTTDHVHARFRYSDDLRADKNSPAPPER
ncbi:MAG: hypothetical protein R3D66_06180 [Alphaproteobacteria bacterium]